MNMHVAISIRMSQLEAKNKGKSYPESNMITAFSIRLENVKDAIVLASNVTEKQIKSHNRKANIVAARNIFCYLCSKKKQITTVAIGKYLGKHHSSVIHSIKMAQNAIDTNDETFMDIYNKTLYLI